MFFLHYLSLIKYLRFLLKALFRAALNDVLVNALWFGHTKSGPGVPP